LRRTLPLLVVAAATVACFGVAGIFTSRVSTSVGDHVLLKGRNCGLPRPETDSFFTNYVAYVSQRFMSSGDYALRCYSNTSLSQGCPTFLRRRLAWRSAADAACPFPGQTRVCRRNATNVRLETGFIDSNADLGINLPARDSFRFRSVVECAPLRTSGFARNVTMGGVGHNYTRTVYLYGLALAAVPVSNIHPHITYIYSADSETWFNDAATGTRGANREYTIQ
jgi:hypothetical protein